MDGIIRKMLQVTGFKSSIITGTLFEIKDQYTWADFLDWEAFNNVKADTIIQALERICVSGQVCKMDII